MFEHIFYALASDRNNHQKAICYICYCIVCEWIKHIQKKMTERDHTSARKKECAGDRSHMSEVEQRRYASDTSIEEWLRESWPWPMYGRCKSDITEMLRDRERVHPRASLLLASFLPVVQTIFYDNGGLTLEQTFTKYNQIFHARDRSELCSIQ